MVDAHAFIKEKWTALNKSPLVRDDTTVLHALRPENDLDTSIPELDAILIEITARVCSTTRADFLPSEKCPSYAPAEISVALDAYGDFKTFHLTALENWMEEHLDSWLSRNVDKEDCCTPLRGLMTLYHTAASTAYTGIPISLSVMYLSLL